MKFIKKIKQVKEKLKNPKTRSLTLLGLYALFFIFVFIFINVNTNTNTQVDEKLELSPIENYKNMKSYQYKITLFSNTLKEASGTFYLDTSLFNYEFNKYYYEENLLYLIDNDSYYLSSIDYNIIKLFNNNFYYLLKDLKEESTTTYNDGKMDLNYVVDANLFYNYFFEEDKFYDTKVNLIIKCDETNITNISIDLTNLGIELYKIDIEYSNINNIKNLEFNKENYIYRE